MTTQPTTPPSAPEPTDHQYQGLINHVRNYAERGMHGEAKKEVESFIAAHDRKIVQEEMAGARETIADLKDALAASREECARLGRALEEAAIHLEIVADSNPDHWASEESRDRYAMEAAQMCRRNISTPPSATPAGSAEVSRNLLLDDHP